MDPGCRRVTCDRAVERCRIDPLPDGEACEDGDPCTLDDRCVDGVCAAGEPFGVREVEVTQCLRERCDPATGDVVKEHFAPLCRGRFGPGGVCWAWGCIDECDEGGSCAEGVCAPVVREDGESCNDGNECTLEDRCEAGSCGGTAVCDCETDLDCAAFASPCGGSFRCADYACEPVGDGVDCGAIPPADCRERVCLDKGECAAMLLPEDSPCGEDGEGRCSANGVCLDPGGCGCLGDSDCASREDGDRCNGTLACLLEAEGARCCLPDPETVPACPPPGATERCERWACEASTGDCELVGSLDAGVPCDDGDPCTQDDRCEADGACAGQPLVCEDDADPCTAAVCDAETGSCAQRHEPRDGAGCDASPVAVGNAPFWWSHLDTGADPPLLMWQTGPDGTQAGYRFLQLPVAHTEPGLPVPHGDTPQPQSFGEAVVDWGGGQRLLVWTNETGGYARVVAP